VIIVGVSIGLLRVVIHVFKQNKALSVETQFEWRAIESARPIWNGIWYPSMVRLRRISMVRLRLRICLHGSGLQ
jgi:hypothetical protein